VPTKLGGGRSQIDIADTVDMFLAGLGNSNRRQISSLADMLQANGNPAFRSADPDITIHVPALLDRENLLEQTLGQIRTQHVLGGAALSVVIAVNPSAGVTDGTLMRSNLRAIHDFTRLLPNELAVSHYDIREVPEGTPYGWVASTMHAASLLHASQRARRQSLPLRDTLEMGWHADTLKAPPGFLQKAWNTYLQSDRPAWIGYPLVRHDRLDCNFPRINCLLAWGDMMAVAGKGLMPMQYLVNRGAYAKLNGFDPNRDWGETGELFFGRIGRHFAPNEFERHPLGVPVVVSARHLIANMLDGISADYPGLQTPAGDNFSDYRVIQAVRDVPSQYFQAELGRLSRNSFEFIFQKQLQIDRSRGLSRQEAMSRAAGRIVRIAEAAIKVFGDLEGSGDIIRERLAQVTDAV